MKPHTVRSLVPCLGLVTVSLALAACSSSEPAQSPEKIASEQSATANRLDTSAQLVSQFRDNIPDSIASSTRCVVVVPGLVKAGLVFGGQSGKGFAACQTGAGWSTPAPISISGGSIGAQIGVQSTDVLALITSDSAKQALETGNFKVGTDASAAAGPVGKSTPPTPELATKGEVLSYTKSQGLYAGVSLTGSTIKPDQDAVVALYGAPLELRSILEGQAPMPNDPAAQRFTASLVRALPAAGVALR